MLRSFQRREIENATAMRYFLPAVPMQAQSLAEIGMGVGEKPLGPPSLTIVK